MIIFILSTNLSNDSLFLLSLHCLLHHYSLLQGPQLRDSGSGSQSGKDLHFDLEGALRGQMQVLPVRILAIDSLPQGHVQVQLLA